MAPDTSAPTMIDVHNPRVLRMAIGNRGTRARASITKNTASNTNATAIEVKDAAEFQSPRVMFATEYNRKLNPAVAVPAAARLSGSRASRDGVDGSSTAARANAVSPIGTLTKKTQRQPSALTSPPPSNRPRLLANAFVNT